MSYNETMTKLNVIKLVVGDWSYDGHNMTREYIIETQFTTKEVMAAYKAGSKKLKFNFIDTCCTDYEDNQLQKPHIKKLIAAGIDMSPFLGEPDENGEYEGGMEPESHAELYLEIVKLGAPDFTYKRVANDDNTILIGGYGLFST